MIHTPITQYFTHKMPIFPKIPAFSRCRYSFLSSFASSLVKNDLLIRSLMISSLFLSSAFLLNAGATEINQEINQEISHEINHEANTSASSLRIVSASNPLTQIIAALDQEQTLVGMDRTSHTKPEYDHIPDVGYRIQLSTEGILSLKPDLILLSHDSGPKATVDQLMESANQSNLEVIQFPELESTSSIQNAVNTIAEKLQLSQMGENLNETIAEDAKTLKELNQQHSNLNGFFVLQGGNGHGSPQISGRDTTADKVLDLLNIQNVFAEDYANYRAISIENQMQKRPDIVLLGHTGQFKKDTNGNTLPAFQRNIAGMKDWPTALQPKCVFDVDISHYLVYGIHIYQDNIQLLQAIHTCLAEQK